MVQSGVPDQWWDCVMKCYCYLRTVHDKMADGKTTYKNIFGLTIDGSLIPLGANVEARLHRFRKKMLPAIFMGCVLRAGGGWPSDLLIADCEDLENLPAKYPPGETLSKIKKTERTHCTKNKTVNTCGA